MRLVCQHCGDDDSAYCWIEKIKWYVYPQTEGEGLHAEPDDHEESRPAVRKLTRRDLVNHKRRLAEREAFDCYSCGEEDCVRVVDA